MGITTCNRITGCSRERPIRLWLRIALPRVTDLRMAARGIIPAWLTRSRAGLRGACLAGIAAGRLRVLPIRVGNRHAETFPS